MRVNGKSCAPHRLISELQRPRATLARSWRLRRHISFFSRLSDAAAQAAHPEYTLFKSPQRRYGIGGNQRIGNRSLHHASAHYYGPVLLLSDYGLALGKAGQEQ